MLLMYYCRQQIIPPPPVLPFSKGPTDLLLRCPLCPLRLDSIPQAMSHLTDKHSKHSIMGTRLRDAINKLVLNI